MSNVYYWPFQYGAKSKANAELQKKLGFSTAEADGIFGQLTRKRLEEFQYQRGIPVTGVVDRATEDALFPGNYQRRTPSMQITSNWLSSIVATTGFKYVVAMIATFIASKLGLESGTIEGLLTQAIGLIMGLWGMYEASKSKAVVNGQSVNLTKLSSDQQEKVAEVVAEAKHISLNTLTK